MCEEMGVCDLINAIPKCVNVGNSKKWEKNNRFRNILTHQKYECMFFFLNVSTE